MRSRALWVLVSFAAACGQTLPPAFTVSTVAGDAGLGDGGPAANAFLDSPWGLTFDAKGALYICDWYHERVRKVEADGTMRWAAGAPSLRTPPYNLSEGAADRVYINYPQFITTAPDGTIWFTNTYRIWRQNADGTLTWVAGRNSTSSSSADGTAAKDANLANIRGLAVDKAGLVYFFEMDKRTVRRVNAQGKIETVAGTGKSENSGDGGPASKASFAYVEDIDFDADGNLYVADSGCIRKIDAQGTITRYAGDPNSMSDTGALTGIRLSPKRLAFDPQGNLYVLEFVRIRKITKSGTVSTVAGSGGYNDPYFAEDAFKVTISANDIAADAQGNVYYASSGLSQVLKVTPQGKMQVFAGAEQFRGEGTAAKEAWMHGPESVVGDGKGGFAFVDLFNFRYRLMDAQGMVRTVAGKGNPSIFNPRPAFDAKATAVNAYLDAMAPLASDGAGGFAIFAKNQIFRVLPAGTLQAVAGLAATSYTSPKEGELAVQQPVQPVTGMAYDHLGRLMFGERGALWRIETNGRLTRIAGTGVAGVSSEKGPARELKIGNPTALTMAGDTLYFVDGGLIKKLTADGVAETLAGGGTNTKWFNPGELVPAAAASLSGTSGLAVTPDGVLYAAHTNHYVYRLRPDGMIEKVAGTGDGMFAGDGGPALAAAFKWPSGLAADDKGNLYVTDRNNGVIRKLTPLTAASLRKAGGDEQTAMAGKPFELPLEVEVLSESGVAVSMVPLEVKVTEGDAAIEKGTSATGANGRLAVKVTAKEAGTVAIQVGTAALGMVEFRLTVQPDVPPPPVPPVLAARTGAVAPGMIVVLTGQKLASKTAAVTAADLVEGKLPDSFQGLCVTFGETRAAIAAVSAGAVAVQVPPQLTPGPVAVRGTALCGSEAPLTGEPIEVQVAETAPEFIFASKGEQNLVSAQAGAEGRVRVFMTGLGVPDPAPAAGLLPAEPLAVKAPVTVWLQGRELTAEQVPLAAWAPRAEGWPALRLPEFFGTLDLLAPGLGVVEILPPADMGEEPWSITVKAGEAFTGENTWLRRPPAQ